MSIAKSTSTSAAWRSGIAHAQDVMSVMQRARRHRLAGER
jgi:hypothetical protein